MRRKEREKRSPPARITLWRRVGDCTSLGMFLLSCSPWLAGPLLDGSIHPYPLCIPLEGLTKVVLLVLQGERDCGGVEGPSEEGLLTAVFHNVGSTTSLLTQNKALSYGFGRSLSYGFRYTNSILSRSGITNSVGSHCF